MLTARFDDLRTGEGWRFPAPRDIIRATTTDEVVPALAAVDEATRGGAWAYGFVAYEAAPAFDPALRVRTPVAPGATAGVPLVWFAVTDRPVGVTDLSTSLEGRQESLAGREGLSTSLEERQGTFAGREGLSTSLEERQGTLAGRQGTLEERQGTLAGRQESLEGREWTWDWTEAEHAERVARVRAAIAAGETYQCNLTTRLRSRFTGDPATWYRELADRQQGGFHALLDTGEHTIVSASPECFLNWQGNRLTVVPMKGTAPRGVDHDSDQLLRDDLHNSRKERAENVMIVDLVRNDLSRIAAPGTVRTTRLLDCERYRTVWQLTSTVTAEVSPATGLADVFGALFPCGSVTGAPKARTMALIAELEDSPRGVYCGAIGWVAPPTEPSRARFSVAIRTAVIDNATSEVVYGVGGAITWDSTAPAEFAELIAKTQVLTPTPHHDDQELAVIETMAVRDGRVGHRERHRARLLRAADWFDIDVDHDQLDAQLAELSRGPDRIVRLLLRADGTLDHDDRSLPPPTSQPVQLALDTVATPDSPWRRHKTTRRGVFEQARKRHPEADDVIMVNEAGRITETTIATIAVQLDGQWCTPPVSDGLLPGVGREALVADGRLIERSIRADELGAATALATISSVRGWRDAVLQSGPDQVNS